MDESEKLTALKKAYAEIILNTAKEAAARIMVSERKSLRYHQELLTAKDSALQMLVRLKHMMDSKVSEAEKASLSQRKKIEELEAQLEEAEDIVKDLRDELQQIRYALEKATKNKLPAQTEQNLVGSDDRRRDTTPEEAFNTTESISPLPCSKPETVSGSDFHMGNGYVHDSEFASLRSKEPELYRNGCTQRIRAFERNTFDESLSFSCKDDNKSGIINKELQLAQSHISDNMSEDGIKLDISTVAAQKDCSEIGAPVLRACRWKRKREVKYSKGKAPSIIYLPDMPKGDRYCPDSFSADAVDQSGNISSKIQKNCSESDEAFVKPCYAKDFLEKPDLIFQDSLSLDSSHGQGCNTDVENVIESLVIPNEKESDMNDEMPIESPGNKLLKHTFRRKNKKEQLNSPNGSSYLDECLLDKEIRESQSTPLGSLKSSQMIESPREDQKLARVARQLFCFSETKRAE